VLGIPPPEPSYWWAIGDWWEAIDLDGTPEEFEVAFAKAPKHTQNLFAAHWVISEVMNGALPQFFFNSTGILAPEAKQALTVVGLEESAKALERAIFELGQPYPKDRDQRLALMEPLYNSQRTEQEEALLDRLIDLTDDFLDGLGKGCKDYEPILAAYAARFSPEG